MEDEEAVSNAVGLLSGKWTVKVFFNIETEPQTFTELSKQVDGISNKMLSKTLNQLKKEKVIAKAESVDGYLLTEKGFELKQNLDDLAEWSKKYSGNEAEVLIVEDERSQAELYTKWLDDFETRIVDLDSIVNSFDSEALAVIMDRYLESKKSDRFLKYLSKADIPVVICTGVEPTIEDMNMPFYDYLVKPLDREELQTSLNEIKALEGDEIKTQSVENKKELIKSRNIGSTVDRKRKLAELDNKIGLSS